MNRSITSTSLLIFLLAACSFSKSTQNVTPDRCAGSTDPGARQKFSFEQIIPCLNTASKVGAFTANNITYDIGYDTQEQGGNEYAPASVVYERGVDDADGHAILQCYLLEQNGWNAFVIGLSIESPVGSNVCGLQNTDGSILVLEGGGVIRGPFNSFSDLAQYYIDKNWMQSGGTLRTLKASQVTQITTDQTTPSVLALPWEIQQY